MSFSSIHQNTNKLRILLIDQDEVYRNQLVDVFAQNGFEVHTAVNGLIGFESAYALKPHYIICNEHMPFLHNGSFINHLNRIYYTQLPVIIFYALDGISVLQKAIDSGIDSIVTKPILISGLLKTLKLHLQKYASIRLAPNIANQHISYQVKEIALSNHEYNITEIDQAANHAPQEIVGSQPNQYSFFTHYTNYHTETIENVIQYMQNKLENLMNTTIQFRHPNTSSIMVIAKDQTENIAISMSNYFRAIE